MLLSLNAMKYISHPPGFFHFKSPIGRIKPAFYSIDVNNSVKKSIPLLLKLL